MLILLSFSKDGVEAETDRWPPALHALLHMQLYHRFNISLGVGLRPRTGEEVLERSLDGGLILDFLGRWLRDERELSLGRGAGLASF